MSFAICLFALNLAIAQTPAKDQVNALDKRVGLTVQQKAQAEAVYDAFFKKAGTMSDDEYRNGKLALKRDIDAILTESQRARMNARISPR